MARIAPRLGVLAFATMVLSAIAVEPDTCNAEDGSCDVATAKIQDMRLYDDSRWQYARSMFDQFSKRESWTQDESPLMRTRLLRSVDVMSYTVGVQELYERYPPEAVRSGTQAPDDESPIEEGSRLWCGVPDASHPMAHERRLLDRLLSGLHSGAHLQGLDIGSGYGGWERLLALDRSDVKHIVGVEYQEHIRALAQQFTDHAFEHSPSSRDRVSFWRNENPTEGGNDVRQFLTSTSQSFDFAISFLCLLHIGQSRTEKVDLFQALANRLRPSGRIYFEDLVVLPAALDESKPAYGEKVRRSLWMNVLTTHQDYAQILSEAGFQSINTSTSMVYDVTSAWMHFVQGRTSGFQKLKRGTQFCLRADGAIAPSVGEAQGNDCETLSVIFGSHEHADRYLESQGKFFCEVCEVFWGRGSLAQADCDCNFDDSLEHPPLVGGVIVLAERKANADS